MGDDLCRFRVFLDRLFDRFRKKNGRLSYRHINTKTLLAGRRHITQERGIEIAKIRDIGFRGLRDESIVEPLPSLSECADARAASSFANAPPGVHLVNGEDILAGCPRPRVCGADPLPSASQ